MIGPILSMLTAVSLAVALYRHCAARMVERAYVANRAVGADGIVIGAAGFTLTGANGRALLLLHGSGDSPQSLRYLAERLHVAGYSVHVPLLPGHGRSPRAFARATSADYLTAARGALAGMRASSTWVGVIGLSMGGALAVQLARAAADVRVLVLLAPYLIAPREVRFGVRTAPVWRAFAKYLSGGGNASVHDTVARQASHAYGTFSAGALQALNETAMAARRELPLLTQPILVINSEQDNRIPRALAEQALAEIQVPVEQHWMAGCGHVITVDYCKGAVADLVLAFLARHAD